MEKKVKQTDKKRWRNTDWHQKCASKSKSKPAYKPKTRSFLVPYWVSPSTGRIHILVAVQLEDTKEYPNTYTYSLLGGVCEDKDKSLQACAIREICEETGGYLSLDLEELFGLPPNQSYVPGLIWLSPISNLANIRSSINLNTLRNDPTTLAAQCAENSFVDLIPIDFLLTLPIVEKKTFTRSRRVPYALNPQFYGNSRQDFLDYLDLMYSINPDPPLRLGVWYTMNNLITLLSDEAMKETLTCLYNREASEYDTTQITKICDCRRE